VYCPGTNCLSLRLSSGNLIRFNGLVRLPFNPTLWEGDAMAYTAEDLTVYDNAVALIRSQPTVYAGKAPRAARLAAKAAGDLLQFGVKSLSAESFDRWWLITSQSDWLTINDVYHSEYWHRIIPAPEVGLEAMRPEVLLTALSSILFTVSKGAVDFIVGNGINHRELEMKVQTLLAPEFHGRGVGFLVNERLE
jgi:hypothetical protein